MNITLDDGRTELWQWDTGRKIVVDDKSVSEVHYSKYSSTQAITREVIDGKAEIPNFLLQDTHAVTVYAYSGSIENGYTMAEKTFNVVKKPKPANYVETEEDKAILAKLKAEIGDLSELQTEAKDNLVAAINEAAESGGADWDQKDPTAKDYIKNHPYYLTETPIFTGRLRTAKEGETHYGIYSGYSEDLPASVMRWIKGMCSQTDIDNKKTRWLKIDGHWFEVNIYYYHDYFNISYMKNGKEIFIQSWNVYRFGESITTNIYFGSFFDAVGIKEIIDPAFSFYEFVPYFIPSREFNENEDYEDYSAHNIEALIDLNLGEFPSVFDKVKIKNETFYNILCSSKGEGIAKYTAGNYTITIEMHDADPNNLHRSYSVKLEPDANLDDVIFSSKIKVKWELGNLPKADWAQNDPSAKDYVKNRTHWVDDDGTVHQIPDKYIPHQNAVFKITASKNGAPNEEGIFNVTADKSAEDILDALKRGEVPYVILDDALLLFLNDYGHAALFVTFISQDEHSVSMIAMMIDGENSMGMTMDLPTKEYVDDREFILKSTTPNSTKKFKITVDDAGTLSAVEVTES